MDWWILLAILAIDLFAYSRSEVPVMAKYYCVIGSGPAGLQMAHFLEKAQRDYIVFEKMDKPGTSFDRYPRHRRLISTNNRTTGSSNKEYNLRYDLNSLISDEDSLLFTKYSEELFPMADDLVEYLGDYHKKLKLNIQFNTEINNVTYHENAKTMKCRYTMSDQEENWYCCRDLFVATGWQKEKIPDHLRGLDYVHTYGTMPLNPEEYKDKTVLVIGRGFSGIETALALDESARYVDLVSANPIGVSWEARYLHNIRGTDKKFPDSTEGFFEMDVDRIELKQRKNGKIQVTSRSSDEVFVPLEGYDHVILCLGFQWDNSIFDQSMNVRSMVKTDIPKNTYPEIGNDYQSTQYPGLYFIGPLAHGLDHKKSAGGFIHGFRNMERALHRLLEWRNHGVKWPSLTKSIDQLLPTLLKRADESSGIYHMFTHLCDLAIYESSTRKFTYLEELPLALIPHILKNSGYEFNPAKHSAFILLFQYGGDFSLSMTDQRNELKDVDLSNLLHPVVYYYEKSIPTVDEIAQEEALLPKASAVHHVLQGSTKSGDDSTASTSTSLRRFIEGAVGEDLRVFTGETCLAAEITHKRDSTDEKNAVCRNYNIKYDSSLLFQ